MRRFRDALIVSGLIVLSSHADLQIEMLKNEAASTRAIVAPLGIRARKKIETTPTILYKLR